MRVQATLCERLLVDENYRQIISPAADILEEPSGYAVHCIMPGLQKENIHLRLDNEEVFVQAQAQLDPPPGMHVHSLEFCSSLYRLRLALPSDVDKESISAEYSDGVLTLTLPRKKQSLVRRVDVESS